MFHFDTPIFKISTLRSRKCRKGFSNTIHFLRSLENLLLQSDLVLDTHNFSLIFLLKMYVVRKYAHGKQQNLAS